MRRVPFMLLGVLLLVACSEGGQEQQAVTARPDSTAVALESYNAALFDTIAWKTDTAQTNRGAVVWTVSCTKCHGVEGRGDAKWVVDGDTLAPPDFTAASWRFATDKAALMQYVYAGNQSGMPHWGIQGLKPRDIEAVATYIQKMLVPPPAAPPAS